MKLDTRNYHSPEANMAFWSNSQFKEFASCPARAVAGLLGTYHKKRTKALCFGSLLDRCLTCDQATLDEFMHGPEMVTDDGDNILYDKKGQLRDNADVRAYLAVRERAEKEPMLSTGMKTWPSQVIFTGTIAGLPWKVMYDWFIEAKGGTVIDLKFMCDLADDWAKDLGGKNLKVPWYDAAGYFRSMATYRHVAAQATGKTPVVALFAFTKQDPPDACSISFEAEECTDRFQREIEQIESRLPEFEKMKRGEIEAPGCDLPTCDFCRGKHTLDRVVSAVSGRFFTIDE